MVVGFWGTVLACAQEEAWNRVPATALRRLMYNTFTHLPASRETPIQHETILKGILILYRNIPPPSTSEQLKYVECMHDEDTHSSSGERGLLLLLIIGPVFTSLGTVAADCC